MTRARVPLFALVAGCALAGAVWFFGGASPQDAIQPVEPGPVQTRRETLEHLEVGDRAIESVSSERVAELEVREVAAMPSEPDLEPWLDGTGSPETWALTYADMGWRDLSQEYDKVRAHVIETARPELERRIEQGIYTLVPPSPSGSVKLNVDGFHEGLVACIVTPDNELRRYEVGEAHYPDLYALSRKARWLRTEIVRRGGRLRGGQ